ncbi:uncharacterized protein LOC109533090 [Dendroctonus ponderosae]|nr:uncharacterized protein LOC109533090 [Dendroctonus ponderosae]KAH1001389.1 hypothetical protein HUJ05_008568 [Dendroctonus ponderosae]
MIGIKTGISRLCPSLGTLIRPLCSKAILNETSLDFSFREQFSSEEHSKILQTINESSPEELSRYKISNGRLKGITDWKQTKGPFKSVGEVLEVDGFGEKALKDICKRIVDNNLCETKLANARQYKNIKNLVLPELSSTLTQTLEDVVAIHLDPSGIGWSKIKNQHNLVTDWEYRNFSSLPAKMLPSDAFYLALDIVKAIPSGDLYIFEAPPILSPQNLTKHGVVATHNQHVELQSMLLTLLNTSEVHNKFLETIADDKFYSRELPNVVFYLKNKVAARLFKTLIGYEKVSAITAITGIVKDDAGIVTLLPCSPVKFDCNVYTAFLNQSSANKELLAQALMLAVSFMDLCIYKNVDSYDALKPTRKKK